jgi:hypothetical protein
MFCQHERSKIWYQPQIAKITNQPSREVALEKNRNDFVLCDFQQSEGTLSQRGNPQHRLQQVGGVPPDPKQYVLQQQLRAARGKMI